MKKPPRKKDDCSNVDTSTILNPLIEKIGKKIMKIQRLAKQYGIFLDDRELLGCEKCGLEEDVAFDGRLFVYNKSDTKYAETGLQFQPLDSENVKFKCPGCGSVTSVPNAEQQEEHE